MLISCKCLNFIGIVNSAVASNAAVALGAAVAATADANVAPLPSCNATPADNAHADGMGSNGSGGSINQSHNYSSNNTMQTASGGCSNSLAAALLQTFLQKYPRNFAFYSQCMDFFKQSIGPNSDLVINAINQRDLMYSLTLDVPYAQTLQTWQISICINCNKALCAKRLQGSTILTHPPQFLINASLLTSNEELAQRRSDKSFSDTFGLLIMNHPMLRLENGTTNVSNASNFAIGSLSSISTMPVDMKQQRIRQLQYHLQQRLKREIAETEERIQRYTDQQFALLKSFREKSEQEYKMLTQLIQEMPEQQATEWLDRGPPALEVNGNVGVGVGVGFVSRRRNTIGSRRDLISTPTTPTTPNPPSNAINLLAFPITEVTAAAATTIPTATSAMDTNTNSNTQGAAQGVATVLAASSVNRKMSNFDTPPATPEATPMSVGNSPTFRQQQQLQQQQQSLPQQNFVRLTNSHSFQQQFPTPTTEVDDFLFELEGVDVGGSTGAPPPPSSYSTLVSNLTLKLPQQQQHQFQQRSLSNQLHHHHYDNHMSDLDESDDGAEEAEDALDMDRSMPLPIKDTNTSDGHGRADTADMLNFVKSLPIEISNSPMAQRPSYISRQNEDELDNNVDIAASIKALAKSVHGEAVFGDLPRPRLRSQI